MTLSYKYRPQIDDFVSILIRTPHGDTTDIQARIVGVRNDYSNPDQKAVLLAGLDGWIVLGDNVEIGLA
jgi:hypothetical protein